MTIPGAYNERVNETPLYGDGHGTIDGGSFAAYKKRACHTWLVAGRACQALRREPQDDFRHRERFSEACAATTHRSQAALGIANGTAATRREVARRSVGRDQGIRGPAGQDVRRRHDRSISDVQRLGLAHRSRAGRERSCCPVSPSGADRIRDPQGYLSRLPRGESRILYRQAIYLRVTELNRVLGRLSGVEKSGFGWKARCPVPGHGQKRGASCTPLTPRWAPTG